MKISEIRKSLVNRLPLAEAVRLRTELETRVEVSYRPKNPPNKVLAFLRACGDGLQMRRVHPQDTKVPYVWQLFTPKTQWVVGDCLAECLDKAMKVKADWSQVSTTDVNALILAHQAIKDARREDTVQVSEVE